MPLAASTEHPDWEPLPPEHVPRPTYCPAGMALGVALIFWGLILSWVVTAVGTGLLLFMLGGWIAEIRHARNHS